jgi:phytoene synthase
MGRPPRRPARGGIAWAATQLASSAHVAIGDDALKDLDNAGWVFDLPPSIQRIWLERIRAIRLADRLAENQQLDPASHRFDRFVGGLDDGAPMLRPLAGQAPPDERPRFDAQGLFEAEPAVAAAWTRYLAALDTYHRHDLRLPTLADHRAMLDRLSGSLFQLVPFLSPTHFEAIRGLGVLDQFFNNLRDLAEDAAQGICYFPEDVLARVGLRRGDLLGDGWRSTLGWPKLVRFWLDEYLPELERDAAGFDGCHDLHPSVARLRRECRARYRRILHRFRTVGFDFRCFADEYWREVRERARANPRG